MVDFKDKKIVIAEQDLINLAIPYLEDFFYDTLKMSIHDCLITDESWLSDFSSCGIPEELVKERYTLNDLYNEWDKWIVKELMEKYKIEIDSTNITLIELADKFKNRQIH